MFWDHSQWCQPLLQASGVEQELLPPVLCSATEPSPGKPLHLSHLWPIIYSSSACPDWHSYTQIAEHTWGSPVATLGAEGEMCRIRKVFPDNPWRLFVPEEAPHAARQGCVINTVNEVELWFWCATIVTLWVFSLDEAWEWCLNKSSHFVKLWGFFFFPSSPSSSGAVYLCQ